MDGWAGQTWRSNLLFRPHVQTSARLPWIVSFNGCPVTDQEGDAAAAVFGSIDAELMQALVMPGQRAALAGARLPMPPLPSQAPAAATTQHSPRQQTAPGNVDGGSAAWLSDVLAHLSGGTQLAAVCAGEATKPAKQGAAFVARWLDEAEAIQTRLGELDDEWGVALIEPCVDEGWRGHYCLPPGCGLR